MLRSGCPKPVIDQHQFNLVNKALALLNKFRRIEIISTEQEKKNSRKPKLKRK
jgi:hypothetical protein